MPVSPLGIVVLNWNNAKETLTCLDSLSGLDYPGLEVLVVDNGSTDGSVEIFREKKIGYPILENGKNLGYAGGNNAGIHWMLERGVDWILLLNNDAILESNALKEMVEIGEREPGIGILGPKVYHAFPSHIIQSAGGSFDKYWRSYHRGQDQEDHGQFDACEEVDWITGCAMLARSEMIRQIGAFDERFFLYEEELEWCVRAKKAGWKIMYTPKAQVWHSGVSPEYQPKPYITYYMTRNHFLLLSKHRAGFIPWLYSTAQTARTLLSWYLRPKWRSKKKHRAAMQQGAIDFFRKRWGERDF
jgi:GT2 family glycosyltransferase